MSIEQRFNVPMIAELALREKQIQQNYRPIIGVHKWFARRPGTLFRGLLLAEFGSGPLDEVFFRSNDLPDITIADPFMGGGTPLMEANRVGCDVEGFDVNPMATWIVGEEITPIDLDAYEKVSADVLDVLDQQVGSYYRTRCPLYGDEDVPVKSFLWVKVLECEKCGAGVDLFPGYVVARKVRHPRHVLLCGHCGELNEVADAKNAGDCGYCGERLRVEGPARRGRCRCAECGHSNAYPSMAEALKPGAPLAFTYHHNSVDAYAAAGVGILDAGLTCTASLPCPAEMGGSIHIHGTGSSIIDTVFVCREPEIIGGQAGFDDAKGFVDTVVGDIAALTAGGRRPSLGDVRCIALGQATRMAVRNLRDEWDDHLPTVDKLSAVRCAIQQFGDPKQLAAEALREGKATDATEPPATSATEERQIVLSV